MDILENTDFVMSETDVQQLSAKSVGKHFDPATSEPPRVLTMARNAHTHLRTPEWCTYAGQEGIIHTVILHRNSYIPQYTES